MIKYSIVIPCYRSSDWLEELVDRIATTMTARSEPFELILVNDASPDGTWQKIQTLAASHSFVRGIDLLFNTGQFRATLCGLEHVRGELVIIMDDDLQHAPEEIPTLIEEIEASPELDCVMAHFETKQHGFLRRVGSAFASWLFTKLYGKPSDVAPSSFRILRRTVVDAMCQHETVDPVIGPLIYRSTKRIGNVVVPHQPRSGGRSGYSLTKLARIVLNSYFSVSTLPLRVVSLLGLCSAVGSLCLGVYYLVGYLVGWIRQPGFTTLVLLVIFFGGLTLFSIGLLGEYVIRIMNETRRPPRYAIRQSVGEASENTKI